MLECKVGIDIVENERIEALLQRNSHSKIPQIFTEQEWEYCQTKKYPVQSLAARFAAKEACLKLFQSETNNKDIEFSDIEISINNHGAPYLKINEILQNLMEKYLIKKIHLSISHTQTYACAIAIADTI